MFRILPRCRLIYISQNDVVSSRLKIGIWSDVVSFCAVAALMSSIRSSISSRTKQCWIVWCGMWGPRGMLRLSQIVAGGVLTDRCYPPKLPPMNQDSRYIVQRGWIPWQIWRRYKWYTQSKDQSAEVVTRSSRLFEAAMRAPTMPQV